MSPQPEIRQRPLSEKAKRLVEMAVDIEESLVRCPGNVAAWAFGVIAVLNEVAERDLP